MKSGLLLLAVAFALFLTADGYRRKRDIDSCGYLSCPQGSVKCIMQENNKENISIIKTTLKCIDDKDTVLKEDIMTRPNDYPGLKISHQKTSVNINKSIHSQHSNKQSWDTKNVEKTSNNCGSDGHRYSPTGDWKYDKKNGKWVFRPMENSHNL